MQRIDLVCKVGAPAVLGFILQVTPLFYVLIGIAIWNAVSLFPELFLLLLIYKENEYLLDKNIEETEIVQDDESTDNTLPPELDNVPEVITCGFLRTTLGGWYIYLTHKIFFASLAYVLLYCTVLAPGGIFNAYLKTQGIQDWMLGTMTGIAAVIGLAATYVQPYLSRKYIPQITGSALLWGQLVVLIPAIIAMLLNSRFSLYILMGVVALARFPLWGFDLVERQIMQTGIAKMERGIVNSVESSMTSVATLAIYILGTIFADPDQFIILCIASILSVFGACLSFSAWSLFYPVATNTPKANRRDEDIVQNED